MLTVVSRLVNIYPEVPAEVRGNNVSKVKFSIAMNHYDWKENLT